MLRQLLLPMVGGMEATKRALVGLVRESGMLVMRELFAEEVEKVAGAMGLHVADRAANHWGSSSGAA